MIRRATITSLPSSLKLTILLLVVVCAATSGLNLSVSAAAAQQPSADAQGTQSPGTSACAGVLKQSERLKSSLLRVAKYQKTYVLVLAGSTKDKISSPKSSELASVPIEINDEPQSIAVAEDLHLTNARRVATNERSPSQPLTDLAEGKTEAVIVWAPVAGAALIDLGLDDKVSIFSVDRPISPPAGFATKEIGVADKCAAAIADELSSFGVQPAELLVPVNIRSLLGTPAPTFGLAAAREGGQAFEQVCARCHGSHAVADPTLAPVDLLRSIRRFQFVGFKYIVMNGRPQKGMPPLRGTVSEEQIALIFQYLQARSKNQLTASSQANNSSQRSQ